MVSYLPLSIAATNFQSILQSLPTAGYQVSGHFRELIRMRLSPANGSSSTPPLKKKVTCAYFSVSEIRSQFCRFFAIHSPKVSPATLVVVATAVLISAAYSGRTKFRLTTFLRAAVEISINESAVISRARSAEVHENHAVSPSSIAASARPRRGQRSLYQTHRFHHERGPQASHGGIRSEIRPGRGHQIIRFSTRSQRLSRAVHSVVTTDDRRHAALPSAANLSSNFFSEVSARRRVATVEEARR